MSEEEETPKRRPAPPAEQTARWQHGLRTRRGRRKAEARRPAEAGQPDASAATDGED